MPTGNPPSKPASPSPAAEAEYTAGIAANEAGDLAAAEAHFRTATELDPDYLAAYFNWGAVLLETDRLAEAVAVFERAIAVDKEFPLAHFMLGTAYGMLGEPRLSFFATVAGLQHAPGDVRAQANAARAAFQLHAYTDASVRYLLAIRAGDQANHAYLINLGASLMHLLRVGPGELLGADGGFDLQDPASLARLALGVWCLGIDEEAQEHAAAVAVLDPAMGAKLTQVFATQEPLRQSLFKLAAQASAEPTFATEELTGGRA